MVEYQGLQFVPFTKYIFLGLNGNAKKVKQYATQQPGIRRLSPQAR